MRNQPDDIHQWIQELVSRSAADQLQNLRRFEEMLRLTMRGENDQPKMLEEYLHFTRQESTRYINDLTRIGLSFYNTLLELNRHYNDRFFEQMIKERPAAGVASKGEPRRIEMELHGPPGSDATRSFVIENQRTEPVSASFLISEFTSQDGKASFRPPLQLSPAHFILPPGHERLVNLKIPLLEEFFTPGQLYIATVLVGGFEDIKLQLKVWADPPQPSPVKAEQTGRRQPIFYPVEETPNPSAVDDLKRIKGIGPVTEHKLQSGGVQTYLHLAECDRAELERLLGANLAARSIREQWQEQARHAAAGDWTALAALQKGLS